MKHLLIKLVCIGALCFTVGHSALAQQQKYALIIGVKSYQHVAPLQNSLNDAHDMAAMLKKKGFTVVELYDPATKRAMQDGILRYFKLLQAQPNAAGLVFYSGHGMQVKGINYLIPTQADPQIEADLDDQCVNMDYVMHAIEEAGNGLNIFVLDACRNNPFRSFSRSGEKGLSMVDTPKGSYIVYATKPGSVASDGTGRNGLFTSKLLQYINTEGLNIEQVFKRTAHDVATVSGDAQRPWIASDYTGDFFFTPGSGTATNQPITQPMVKAEPVYVAPLTKALDYGYGTADARTVNVGRQEWLSKNLNVDHFSNGDAIPEASTAEEWKRAGEMKQPAWCHYNNDPANGQTYGKLYNWYAVNDARGLAPKGWHVPIDMEWTTITSYLGGEATAGTSLKSTNGWENNGNGNNKSGIAGLPGGFRLPIGTFSSSGRGCGWWSSSEGTSEGAWGRDLGFNYGNVNRLHSYKGSGFSVRLVKTEPVYVAPVTTALDYGYGTADARTVNVGTQEWLGKNLNVDHFSNGDAIPEARTAKEWKRAGANKQPAWCHYNNEPANGQTYGKLYNWYAVNDARGLAPKGWHVPSDGEWTAITSYLGGEATPGTSLKSTNGWENNGNGNDKSGIAGLPGGIRLKVGTFLNLGRGCGWWSSSVSTSEGAWGLDLGFNYGNVNRLSFYKDSGFSVRCLRD